MKKALWWCFLLLYAALLFSQERSNTYSPAQTFGGLVVDGVKYTSIMSAYSDCSSKVGGVIEVPAGYSETVLEPWVLNKKYCVIHHRGPCAISFGVNTITVSAGAHGARIFSDIPLGSVVVAQNTGCVYNYAGSGTFITIGASSSDTLGFGLDRIALNLHDAGSAAVALHLVRVQEYELNDFNCIGRGRETSQQCLILDGRGNFTGGEIRKPRITGMRKGIQLTGDGVNAANANTIISGNIASPPTGASIGIDFEAGSGGNVIDGTDVEGFAIGYNFGGTSNGNSLRVRSESNASGVTFGPFTGSNKVELINSADPYTLAGTNNTVENRFSRTSTNSLVYTQACSGTATAASTLAIQWTGGACTSPAQKALVPLTNPGTLSNFRVKCGTAGVNPSSGVFTLRVNAASSALTCTVGTGTSCADNTHTVRVAAGDQLQTIFTTQPAETLADCAVSWEKQ